MYYRAPIPQAFALEMLLTIQANQAAAGQTLSSHRKTQLQQLPCRHS